MLASVVLMLIELQILFPQSFLRYKFAQLCTWCRQGGVGAGVSMLADGDDASLSVSEMQVSRFACFAAFSMAVCYARCSDVATAHPNSSRCLARSCPWTCALPEAKRAGAVRFEKVCKCFGQVSLCMLARDALWPKQSYSPQGTPCVKLDVPLQRVQHETMTSRWPQ